MAHFEEILSEAIIRMSLSIVPNYIWAGLFSALAVGLAVYVADQSSPFTAGFLAAFPVALCSMIFISQANAPETSRSFALGILSYAVFAMLFYSLISQNGWNHNQAVMVCVGGWLLTAIIMWMLAR